MSSKALEVIAVRRAPRFSPRSVERDDAILKATCRAVERRLGLAYAVPVVDEESPSLHCAHADVVVTMARSREALSCLERMEAEGTRCVNSVRGVRQCQRSVLDALMRQAHIAMPPADGSDGWWLKRGDAAAQSHADVVFCPDEAALQAAVDDFRRRGITDYVKSSHVKGDLVKFYGVSGRLFKTYYPTDDGFSKFGDERRNGSAHHYAFDAKALRAEVERLAGLVGVAVYGGDAIVDSDGNYYIIDFNDWPSFSRCREEAAAAIADYIESTQE